MSHGTRKELEKQMYRRLMKEIENTEEIMKELRSLLAEVDPSYPQEESKFRESLQKFKHTLDETQKVLLDCILEEEEKQIATSVIYLFWKGLNQNLKCFQDPVAKQFLRLDYEDIHQESIMNQALAINTSSISQQFFHLLTEEQQDLNPISSYYSYIKTIAYKVVHYYGFRFGDVFLPTVVPGYIPDGTSCQYALQLMHDMSIKL